MSVPRTRRARGHWRWAALVLIALVAAPGEGAAQRVRIPTARDQGEAGVGNADRPLALPEALRGDSVDADWGVQIMVGPHAVALQFDRLGINDSARPAISEGVYVSVDAALGLWRVGYSRQFYRRKLPAGSQFDGKSANFLGIDGDQIWTALGWRPWLPLYLAAGLGAQHRLVRVKQDASTLFTDTETVAMSILLADLALAPPFSLQFRLVRDDGKLLRMDSAMLQLAYLVPF